MILAIGAHPSLEKTTVVSSFTPGRAFRINEAVVSAGSKGFNFARALRAMGKSAKVVSPLAGHTGRHVFELAVAEGLDCAPVWLTGETRSIYNLVDSSAGGYTELIENGPVIDAVAWGKIRDVALQHLPAARWLVVCGSFLPGTPETCLSEVMAAAETVGVPVALDTYGPPLALALQHHQPALLKINQHEAGDLLGRAIATPAETVAAAIDIQQRGPQAVIISMGALGAAGVDAQGNTFGWTPPPVDSLCAIGSGDALLAGIMAQWADGESLKEAARWGIAAGTANTITIGPGRITATQIENLAEHVTAW
jgi:1-phosphofructokinase family hexose kinase